MPFQVELKLSRFELGSSRTKIESNSGLVESTTSHNSTWNLTLAECLFAVMSRHSR